MKNDVQSPLLLLRTGANFLSTGKTSIESRLVDCPWFIRKLVVCFSNMKYQPSLQPMKSRENMDIHVLYFDYKMPYFLWELLSTRLFYLIRNGVGKSDLSLLLINSFSYFRPLGFAISWSETIAKLTFSVFKPSMKTEEVHSDKPVMTFSRNPCPRNGQYELRVKECDSSCSRSHVNEIFLSQSCQIRPILSLDWMKMPVVPLCAGKWGRINLPFIVSDWIPPAANAESCC